MSKVLEAEVTTLESSSIWDDVLRVAERIPPLWDLNNYVAVNPFLGFSSEPIAKAAQVITDGLSAKVLPDLAYYRAKWEAGAFDLADLQKAAQRMGHSSEFLRSILEGKVKIPTRPSSHVLTFAEQHDLQCDSNWDGLFIRSAARWCAVFASDGGTHWPLRHDDRGLFAFWHDAVQADRSFELHGIKGFRNWVRQLPLDPAQAIAIAMERLPLPEADREAYFYRLLGGLYGWASYFRRSSWNTPDQTPGEVADLIAMRVCMDAATVPNTLPLGWTVPHIDEQIEDESIRMVFQEALEDAYAKRVSSQFRPAQSAKQLPARPALQAVFCIDVRSEPYRRHLEAESPTIETRGFAGFFGVALDWRADGSSSARCPVLLKPGVSLCAEEHSHASSPSLNLKPIQVAPGASFSFVELLGLTYGLGLAASALKAVPSPSSTEGVDSFSLESSPGGLGIPLSGRIEAAIGILTNMGFRDSFARIVLLCGHESHSTNNPHAAGLDCGACGGHSGAINARVAAAILNDPAVRNALPARGWNLPSDTHFLPAVHNTTTDEIQVLDEYQLPTSHQADLKQVRNWLSNASSATRLERAPALGLKNRPVSLLSRLLGQRARDWSEVRPEWGLARNAAFIAARRQRTQGINLDGRSFLHEYDADADPENQVLTLILSAPMVVASWINLQYFASTVDNDIFGCGDKTLHNRVGNLGVVLGNGGDLRTGLPLQSVHSKKGVWFHEPLRLQVFVEAKPERISQVLEQQPGVRELIDNGWVRLFAMDPRGTDLFRMTPSKGWERIDGASE